MRNQMITLMGLLCLFVSSLSYGQILEPRKNIYSLETTIEGDLIFYHFEFEEQFLAHKEVHFNFNVSKPVGDQIQINFDNGQGFWIFSTNNLPKIIQYNTIHLVSKIYISKYFEQVFYLKKK